MSGYSYSDEIGASFDRIEDRLRKGQFEPAVVELEHVRKLVSAELSALAEETRELERDLQLRLGPRRG
jgi:hypothetical protein